MTTTSNANTSGLEVVAWRKNVWVADGIGTGWMLSNQQPEPNHQPTDIEPLVTAASAQARIAELEALLDRANATVAKALNHSEMIELQSVHRATAAEARADRLAKAGDRLIDALHRYGFPVSGGARVALTDRGSNEAVELDEAVSNFRAALQQEDQP